MGQEIHCKARIDGRAQDVKALFETEEILVRGATRMVIPLKKVGSVDVAGDTLQVRWDSHEASLHLGEAMATKWAEKIRNPKSRLDKLGIKPGLRVTVLGVDDAAFLRGGAPPAARTFRRRPANPARRSSSAPARTAISRSWRSSGSGSHLPVRSG